MRDRLLANVFYLTGSLCFALGTIINMRRDW